MHYRRFRKEGPGAMLPEGESIIPYAKDPEELRLLDDVEQDIQNIERAAADEAAGAIALAKSDTIDVGIETDHQASARLSQEALEFSTSVTAPDLSLVDELAELGIRNAANERATEKDEATMARADTMAGDLRMMQGREIQRSHERERALAGEIIPDETIVMETPSWIDPKDPEFAMPAPKPAFMNEGEERASIEKERALAQRTRTGTEFIELGTEEIAIPEMTPVADHSTKRGEENERERMERVLGPSNKAPRPARETPIPVGFFARIKRWFA